MGQLMTSALTQYDVEQLIVQSGGVFRQQEIQLLYKRFVSLDKGNKGYIPADDFINIPELSINPLAQRLTRMFHYVNFRDFVTLLAPFSKRAPAEMKLQFVFKVFDVDGDGVVSAEDLSVMLRQLTGAGLSEQERQQIIQEMFREAGSTGLTLQDFEKVLGNQSLKLDAFSGLGSQWL